MLQLSFKKYLKENYLIDHMLLRLNSLPVNLHFEKLIECCPVNKNHWAAMPQLWEDYLHTKYNSSHVQYQPYAFFQYSLSYCFFRKVIAGQSTGQLKLFFFI